LDRGFSVPILDTEVRMSPPGQRAVMIVAGFIRTAP
jgi:hypothetical protein